MKNKIFYIFIICVVVILCAVASFFIYKNSISEKGVVHQKCPEDYAEDDAGTVEYKNDMADWSAEFFKAHPEATVSDWSMARAQLRVDNNCTVAIQRSKMSGEVADLKPYELVDYNMQMGLIDAIEKP